MSDKDVEQLKADNKCLTESKDFLADALKSALKEIENLKSKPSPVIGETNQNDIRHCISLIDQTIDALNVGACGTYRLEEVKTLIVGYLSKPK